jgi:hypothetical protein
MCYDVHPDEILTSSCSGSLLVVGLTVVSGDVIKSSCLAVPHVVYKWRNMRLSYSLPSTPCRLLGVLLNKPFRPPSLKQKKSKRYKLVPWMLHRAIKC